MIHLDDLEKPEALKTPLDYFYDYFGNERFEKMTFSTNLYASQKYLGTRFKLTNVTEMKTFIAIHIIMGTFRLPRMVMYWENINSTINLITQNMTHNIY